MAIAKCFNEHKELKSQSPTCKLTEKQIKDIERGVLF